jgi:type II secretory pathway component PulM
MEEGASTSSKSIRQISVDAFRMALLHELIQLEFLSICVAVLVPTS